MRPTMAMTGLLALPGGCIADIISLTSPRDACRLACVSTAYRSTVDSDPVWDRFLPPQCLAAIPDSASLSKKQLYLRACHDPVLINDGKLSFWLDKPSGKKCYMISARELTIAWGDTPAYWGWIQLPEARFPEVAELRDVCWFDISARISTSILSRRTTYVFYLVFKPVNDPYRFENYPDGFEDNPVYGFIDRFEGNLVHGFEDNPVYGFIDGFEGNLVHGFEDNPVYGFIDRFEGNLVHGFEDNPVEVTIGLADSDGQTRTVYLDPTERRFPTDDQGFFPEERGDGWFECELGEYFYGGDEDGELSMTIKETEHLNWKSGLVFQGIEIRPKKE